MSVHGWNVAAAVDIAEVESEAGTVAGTVQERQGCDWMQ